MEIASDFAQTVLSSLADQPRSVFKGAGFTARIAIPDYDQHVSNHYKKDLTACRKALGFSHFGVIVEFDQPRVLKVHDDDQRLDENLRALIARFGPCLFRNVHLPEQERVSAQRNIFPNLRFHIDRGSTQVDQISMFWRDPRDPIQAAPRTSSTLLMANHAAYLQALEEGHGEHAFKMNYDFFADKNITGMIGKVLFELPWNAGHGVGEISLLDNRNALHASYYPHASNKGYPISVRYLV